MRVQRFTDWQAEHPEVIVDGNPAGKWLVYKPCLKQARRFASYFMAQKFAPYRDICRCRENHYIVELAESRSAD
jgi:hypothetical protein